VNGGSEANPVHLTHEDLVTEEVRAPDAAVRVSEVMARLFGDIGKITDERVGGVVLLADIVEMLSMLGDLVVANHVPEKLKLVVILVVNAWGVEEYTDVRIVHLVVTHHEERGNVDALLRVVHSTGALFSDGGEGFADLADESVVIDGTSANDDHVFASVVIGAVSTEHIGVDVLKVIRVTTDRLAHHVVTEGVIVAGLERGANKVLVEVLVVGSLLLLGHLKLGIVEGGILDGITKEGDSAADVTLEAGHVDAGNLTIGVSANVSTHALNFLSELSFGGTLGALEHHASHHVGSTGGLKSIVAGTGLDVDTNASGL